jgi:hypothetical protein
LRHCSRNAAKPFILFRGENDHEKEIHQDPVGPVHTVFCFNVPYIMQQIHGGKGGPGHCYRNVPDGIKVYGVHATFKDMDISGDIIHGDPARVLSVDLKSTRLSGAINGAYVTLDEASKWTATGNSSITIVGSFNGSQIDAPAGVTITALAGQSGTYKVASGGTLILKVS